MSNTSVNRKALWRAWAAMVAFAAVCTPSWALYKVVGPDGSVTYTDQPPSDPQSRWAPANPRNLPAASDADANAPLPAELRGPASRYPVTLYTGADCAPCASARELLARRGIPYAERRVETNEDLKVFGERVGGRIVPALTVGAQALPGFSDAEWHSYLDAAGYPRESRLPPNYRQPAAHPLTTPRLTEAPATDATRPLAPPEPSAPAAATPPRNPSGIRF